MSQFDPAHVDRGGPPHRYGDGPLEVTKLHVGPYENNAYLLRDPGTNDALLVDADGNSAVSMEDYAIAFADEIEHPAHVRERFSVAY